MLHIRRAMLGLGVALTALVTVAGTASAAPSQQDTAWMVSAHQSNLAEIAAGTAAQQSATTDTVKSLGQMFVQMHTDLDAKLTAAAQQLGVQLPDAPSPAQQQSLAAVTAKTGPAFDSAWIAQQLAAHQASRAAGQKELTQGSDPAVKALAEAAAPVVQQHLDSLKQAAGQYGVPTEVQAGSGGQAAAMPWSSGIGLALAAVGMVLVAAGALHLFRYRRSV